MRDSGFQVEVQKMTLPVTRNSLCRAQGRAGPRSLQLGVVPTFLEACCRLITAGDDSELDHELRTGAAPALPGRSLSVAS